MSQAMKALKAGNAVRLPALQLRRDMGELPISEGRRRCAELLLDPPPELGWMTVWFLLEGIRQVGKQRAARIVAEAGLPPSVQGWPIRRLTQRQRAALAEVLRTG